MVNYALLRDLGIHEENTQDQIKELALDLGSDEIAGLREASGATFSNGAILNGKIVNIHGDDVVVEIGLKSEGVLSLSREFDDPSSVEVGDAIAVLLEQVESDNGLVQISKRKADRIRGWESIVNTKKEG